MQYMGGKQAIASKMVPVLKTMGIDCDIYLEPFFGGGSVGSRLARDYELSFLNDADPALMSMWAAVQQGWTGPEHFSEDDYKSSRQLPDSDPLKAFAAYGCSFGGKKWAGYAKRVATPRNPNPIWVTAKKVIASKAAGIDGAILSSVDYRFFTPGEGWLVYCDPPYAGTTGYGVEWDSEAFWSTMRSWRDAGASVAVSEYKAPPDWTPVWSHRKPVHMNVRGEHHFAVERLFV